MCQFKEGCDCHEIWQGPDAAVEEIVCNPAQWLQRMQKEAKLVEKKKYFLTFTKRDDVDEEKWRKRIKFELQRSFVLSFKMCFEHADKNLHAHVILESTKYLRKADIYKTFVRNYGFVDMQLVKVDNGLEQYISKEGEIIDKIENL